MTLLENKVALVSGVGPGMGRDIAILLAENGADLALGARTSTNVNAVADEIESLGRKAIRLSLNIADRESCRQAVDEVTSALGRIDILVNNAFHRGDFRTVEDADLAKWRKTMDVNFFGTLQLTQLVVPVMKRQGDGRIVMINSIVSVDTEPGIGAYSASKSALATATKTLARELGPYGIRVNGIHPGPVWGDQLQSHLRIVADSQGTTFQAKVAEFEKATSLGYVPDSAQIAGSVLFFASDLSKPVTGQALGVNAGQWFQGF
jgi:NAD(P)-dependent dehydrogenase (short-subunit alcohol dehydrogenase family)